jgi:hypothetical protein
MKLRHAGRAATRAQGLGTCGFPMKISGIVAAPLFAHRTCHSVYGGCDILAPLLSYNRVERVAGRL